MKNASIKEVAKAAVKAQREARRAAAQNKRLYFYVLAVVLDDGQRASWRFRSDVDVRNLSEDEQLKFLAVTTERFGVRSRLADEGEEPVLICQVFDTETEAKEFYEQVRAARPMVTALDAASGVSASGGAA